LRAIVLRALQRKPEDRYQSAAEFGAALAALPAEERAPEDPKEISQYVSRALQAETKATEERILSNKSLQEEIPPTLIPVNAPLVANDQRRTVYLGPTVIAAAPGTIPEPARGEPKRKRSRVLVLALTAGAALALAATVLLMRATGPGPAPPTPIPTAVPTQVPPTALPAKVPPSPSSATPTPLQTLPTPTVTPTPRPTRTKSPVKTATPVPPVATKISQAPGPKARFCSQLEETSYKQLNAKEVAPGMQDTAKRAPRPDSGLMTIRITASPPHPSEDDPTFVHVGFENGGDNPVQIDELEWSLSLGGYAKVPGALVPVSVVPGSFKELKQYSVDLRGGEPYRKQFIVVDNKKGDSWRAGFALLPCAQ
jgi:hypothetical protein